MGRLATAIAATAVDASNLPAQEKLPRISLIDALLPDKWASLGGKKDKPLDPSIRRKTYVKYYDIKRNGSGSKLFVAHKASSDEPRIVRFTTGDVRKGNGKGNGNGNGNSNGKGNKGGGQAEKKQNGGGGGGGGNGEKQQQIKGPDVAWTTEEDEKLKAMKAEGKTWKEIGQAIGRGHEQCNKHWQEISQATGDNAQANNNYATKENQGGQQQQNQNQNNQGQSRKDKKNKGGQQNNPNNQPAKSNNQNQNQDNKKNKRQHVQAAPSINSPSTLITLADFEALQETDLFSFGELQCLSELLVAEAAKMEAQAQAQEQGDGKKKKNGVEEEGVEMDQQSWERVAATFWDLTGRRVHWEDVRNVFEGLAMRVE